MNLISIIITYICICCLFVFFTIGYTVVITVAEKRSREKTNTQKNTHSLFSRIESAVSSIAQRFNKNGKKGG